MVKYLENAEVAALIGQGKVYQKSALTGLRKVKPSEEGKTLVTYVKKDGALRQESESVLGADKVLARNPGVIGQDASGADVYNEWPIPLETAVKNYGKEVIDGLSADEVTFHKKKATVQAVELTPEVMGLLGVSGDVLQITVSWSDKPMEAHVGDYLTSGGYSISANDMKDYEAVA